MRMKKCAAARSHRLTEPRSYAGRDHAPPGIIDLRSWAYWNSKLGRYPVPLSPTRRLG
jgi:hypothetical protein